MGKDIFGPDIDSTDAIDKTSIVYYPTLMIGLGGTGAQVLLRVKKLLQERFPDGQYLHKFLLIDTDTATFARQEGLPEVDQSTEACLIGVKSVKNLLDEPTLYPEIWARFPKDRLAEKYILRLSEGIGASQIRSLGALALALDYRQVREHAESARNRLIELAKIVSTRVSQRGATISNSTLVYIVGSLAGGTGSGCMIDVALMAKDVCQGNAHISAMFALPSAFIDKISDEDQKKNLQANTYAALKELQFCLDANSEERNEVGNIPFAYGEAGGLSLLPRDQLFQMVHLIDDRNERGKLSTLDDLYTVIARSVFQEVGTPFGAFKRSFDSNASVFTGIARCKKTNRPRLFGTVSTAALVFPAERVASYCTLRTTASIINDQLLGVSLQNDQVKSRVAGFLDTNKLDERGETNQILDSLLYSKKNKSVLSSADLGLSRSFGKDKNAADFVASIRQEWKRFEETDLPRVAELVDDNKKQRLGGGSGVPGDNLYELLQNFAVSLARDSGTKGVVTALDELEGLTRGMTNELGDEIRAWKKQQENYRQGFNADCDTLQALSTFKQKFSGKDDRLKRQLIIQFGSYVQSSLWAAARGAALDILEKFSSKLKQVQNEWNSLATSLMNLLNTTNERVAALETRKTKPAGHSVSVEIEVTPPGYEQTYYEQSKLDSKKALSLMLNQFGGQIDTFFRQVLKNEKISRLGNLIASPIYEKVAPLLYGTDILAVVDQQAHERRSDAQATPLKELLDTAHMLCQPFWTANTVGGVELKDFQTISAKPLQTTKEGIVFPPQIVEWAEANMFGYIPYESSFEIFLSRRTYGIRAFYLTDAARWKTIYDLRISNFEGSYMHETHTAFRHAPDLFPRSDDLPLRAFALGLALGFIVKRGDWYYFGLERAIDRDHQQCIRVLYKSDPKDWKTAHMLEGVPPLPARVGPLDFSHYMQTLDKEKHQLAQGRANAVTALCNKMNFVELLQEAVEEYHREIGTSAYVNRLELYQTTVLEPLKINDPVIAKENQAIIDEIQNTGR
jgi:hypothetical protein